jgi:hypothetical protein
MSVDVSTTSIFIATVLVGASLPALALAYFGLRRRKRNQIVLARIEELGLESEYLRIFHPAEWRSLRKSSEDSIRQQFRQLCESQFKGSSSLANYGLPIVLTLLVSIVFALVVYRFLSLSASLTDFMTHGTVPLAIAGAFLYVYPYYVSGYASLSLNPQTLLQLLGRLVLSVLIGIVIGSAVIEELRPIAGFLGALIPVPALEFLKKKLQPVSPCARSGTPRAALPVGNSHCRGLDDSSPWVLPTPRLRRRTAYVAFPGL